jgi:hypothetical protein
MEQLMTTKERITRQSFKEVSERLTEIDAILNANPLSDICELRMKAQKAFNGMVDKARLEFLEQIKEWAIEEKRLFALAKKQENTIQLIDEKVKLQMEQCDLNNEIFYIERHK